MKSQILPALRKPCDITVCLQNGGFLVIIVLIDPGDSLRLSAGTGQLHKLSENLSLQCF